MAPMRTHKQIVEQVGVPSLRRILADRGVEMPDPTVRSWARRGSIPAVYWEPLVEAKVTTFKELAASARAGVA